MVLFTIQDVTSIKNTSLHDSLTLSCLRVLDQPFKELRVCLERLEMTPDLKQQILVIQQELIKESIKKEIDPASSTVEGGHKNGVGAEEGENSLHVGVPHSNKVPTSILKQTSNTPKVKRHIKFRIKVEFNDGSEQYLNDIQHPLKSILKSSSTNTTTSDRKLSFCATSESNDGCTSFLNDTSEYLALQNKFNRAKKPIIPVEKYSLDFKVKIEPESDEDLSESESNDSSFDLEDQIEHEIEESGNSVEVKINNEPPIVQEEPRNSIGPEIQNLECNDSLSSEDDVFDETEIDLENNEEEEEFLTFDIGHETPLVSSPIEDPLDEEYLESYKEPELVTLYVNHQESSVIHSLLEKLEQKQKHLEEVLEKSIDSSAIENCDSEVSNIFGRNSSKKSESENSKKHSKNGETSSNVENSDEIMIEFEKLDNKKVQKKRTFDIKRHRDVMKRHMEWVKKSREECLTVQSLKKNAGMQEVIDCNSDSDHEPFSKKKCPNNQLESNPVTIETSTVSSKNTMPNEEIAKSKTKSTSKTSPNHKPTFSKNTTNDDFADTSNSKKKQKMSKISPNHKSTVSKSPTKIVIDSESKKEKELMSKILPERSCRKKITVDSESSDDFEGSEDEYNPEDDMDFVKRKGSKRKSSKWESSSDEDSDESLEIAPMRQKVATSRWNGKTISPVKQKSPTIEKVPTKDLEMHGKLFERREVERDRSSCRRCHIVKTFNLFEYLHYAYSCDMADLLKTVNDIKFLKKPFISQASMWECFNCKETFLVESEVIKHYKKTHGKDISSSDAAKLLVYKCKFCLRTFWCEEDLDVHIESKHPENYVCSYCTKGFLDRASFTSHIRFHVKLKTTLNTNKCDDTPPKCPDCGKKHSEGYDYLCCYCANQFQTYNQLDRHLNVQHLKPYLCHYCEKRFGSVKYLRYHVNSHMGVAKSTCEICRKSFWSVNQLQKHIKVHFKSDVSLHCQFCTTKFLYRHALRRHIINTHGFLSPIIFKSCKLCGVAFENCKAFSEHCDKIHRNMYANNN